MCMDVKGNSRLSYSGFNIFILSKLITILLESSIKKSGHRKALHLSVFIKYWFGKTCIGILSI